MARPFVAPAPARLAAPGGARVVRPLAGTGRLLGACVRWAGGRRRARIALLALAVALPLLACGWLWLRQSPFVAVRRVRIEGVHGAGASAVDAALTQAAHGMSTLEVDVGSLRAAVAPLRVVREVRAVPSFPHDLRIEVVEQLPVAALTVGASRTAVAADGVVLGPTLATSSLPSIGAATLPAPGTHVAGASLLAELTVLGAAPAPLARHVERAFVGAKGLTVAMRNGLLAYFGDDTLPHAKWLSLARVLADSSSAGASYVDVRLPSHPAAGFPAGVTPPAQTATAASGTGVQAGGQESAVASLAAGLSGASPATSSTAGEPAGASAASPAQAGSGTTGETGSGTSGDTGFGTTGEPASGEAGGAQTGVPPGG